ncbi:hypothetical protein OG625_39165 [Streptomyces sp. NBC_01351]|uniref:YbaK/EbsC family protein n=1 Tax=Streptomyces sp. NBC_01351 TaxID=2903833 RepID=UPI002E37833A|nr:YbaK/EbsC family protein [Streptomyces sp. NBC_01351]
MNALLGHFDDAQPAPDCLDLLTPPVAAAVRTLQGTVPAEQISYIDSDPAIADTGAFVERYGQDLLAQSANCVIVATKRGGESALAACLVPSAARVDVNGVVRRQLEVRKASFAAMDTAVELTGMEYGGITPIGLPADWPLLVDSAVVALPYVLIGSGRRRGKLVVPGRLFAELPGAVVLDGLGL